MLLNTLLEDQVSAFTFMITKDCLLACHVLYRLNGTYNHKLHLIQIQIEYRFGAVDVRSCALTTTPFRGRLKQRYVTSEPRRGTSSEILLYPGN